MTSNTSSDWFVEWMDRTKKAYEDFCKMHGHVLAQRRTIDGVVFFICNRCHHIQRDENHV